MPLHESPIARWGVVSGLAVAILVLAAADHPPVATQTEVRDAMLASMLALALALLFFFLAGLMTGRQTGSVVWGSATGLIGGGMAAATSVGVGVFDFTTGRTADVFLDNWQTLAVRALFVSGYFAGVALLAGSVLVLAVVMGTLGAVFGRLGYRERPGRGAWMLAWAWYEAAADGPDVFVPMPEAPPPPLYTPPAHLYDGDGTTLSGEAPPAPPEPALAPEAPEVSGEPSPMPLPPPEPPPPELLPPWAVPQEAGAAPSAGGPTAEDDGYVSGWDAGTPSQRPDELAGPPPAVFVASEEAPPSEPPPSPPDLPDLPEPWAPPEPPEPPLEP
jgi:hypothetical protein